jgi:prolyl 4-hydroxylase
MLDGPNTTVLNINPLVLTVDGFLSEAECLGLIKAAQGRLQRATVSDGAVGSVSQYRTNSHCSLTQQDAPIVLQMLMKIGMVLRIPMNRAEGPIALHYAEAEEFRPHSDGIQMNADADKLAAFERDGGQRLFSAMVYLNTVERGGGTGFPELGLSVQPEPGRLLIFANTLAGSREVTNLSIHAGEPVTAGEKWSVITWWRERPRDG